MFKLVTVLALVATALAAPQSISYDLPASITLGAPSANQGNLVQVVGGPRFAGSDTIHVVAAHPPTPQFVIVAPASKPAPKPEPLNVKPNYSYSYNVNDAETGDNKVASETRDGDKVSGSYSLVEPDGAVRTVTYTADAEKGFNAKVERTPSATQGVTIVSGPKPKPVQAVRPAVPVPAKKQFYFVQYPYAAQYSNLISGINSGHIQLVSSGLNSGSFQLVPAGINAASLQGQNIFVVRH